MDNKPSIENEVWVFLSHSSKDYKSVRLLRNLLEEEGYRPIMFFLCCLNDDEEIADLIKREIDSRRLFILCDSPNARNSAWVQKEVQYIKSKRRYYQTVKLDTPLTAIRDQIIRFRKDSTIYLFYSRGDRALFPLLRNALQKEMGFRICDWHDAVTGYSVKAAVNKALKNGYAFFLQSDRDPSKGIIRNGIKYAQSHKLANRSCVLTESEPAPADFKSVKYCLRENGEIDIDEERLYLHVMLDRIKEGARMGEPASQYWLAYYNSRYCVQYEYGLHSDYFRRYTLDLARSAAEAGYAPAAMLYVELFEDIFRWYRGDFNDNYAKELETLDRLISMFPDCADCYHGKGEILMHTGDWQGAQRMWLKVLELDPDFLLKHKNGTPLYDRLKKEGLI